MYRSRGGLINSYFVLCWRPEIVAKVPANLFLSESSLPGSQTAALHGVFTCWREKQAPVFLHVRLLIACEGSTRVT